jgi:predicted deacylase
MRMLQMVSGPTIAPPTTQRMIVGRRTIRASSHGLFRSHVAIGDRVTTNQVVAEVVDLFGDILEELRAPIDGIIVQLIYQNSTNPGNIVMKIGRVVE